MGQTKRSLNPDGLSVSQGVCTDPVLCCFRRFGGTPRVRPCSGRDRAEDLSRGMTQYVIPPAAPLFETRCIFKDIIFMKTTLSLINFLLFLPLTFNNAVAADFDAAIGKGDDISSSVFVTDKSGSQVQLQSLFQQAESGVNVLFIFGGGDMGAGMPGHLWCQDSFEDTHILRTLYSKYQDQGVNFIPVAAAPVYHTQMLNHPAGVFFNQEPSSPNFQAAQKDFISSTLDSLDSGILPLEPYFDLGYRLMFNRTEELGPAPEYGEVFNWQGIFRAPDESQFYGVPSFWLVNNQGKILWAPFRGNIYHPHGTDVSINYTFSDIDDALKDLL